MKTKFKFTPILLLPILLTFLLLGIGSVASALEPITYVKVWGTQPAGNGFLNIAEGVVIDPNNNNVLVSDSSQNRIQIFKTTGASAYDAAHNWVGLVPAPAGATPATFNGPCSMAFGPVYDNTAGVDTRFFYVADAGNNRVLQYTVAYTVATGVEVFTYANVINSATAALEGADIPVLGPKGVACDGLNNVYISDTLAGVIIRLTPHLGDFILAGATTSFGGVALFLPYGVGVDSVGNIYVTDQQNDRVVKYNPTGPVGFHEDIQWGTTGVAGIGAYGPWPNADATKNHKFNTPMGIWVDVNDKIYVVDEQNCRVLKFNSNGTVTDDGGLYFIGIPSFDLLEVPYGLVFPRGVAVNAGTGHIYVTDTASHVIKDFDYVNGLYDFVHMVFGGQNCDAIWAPLKKRVTDSAMVPTPQFITAGENGSLAPIPTTSNGKLNNPYGIAQKADGGTIFVADSYNHRVQVFTSSGSYARQFGKYYAADDPTPGNDYMVWPFGIVVDPDTHYIYVSEAYLLKIMVYDSGEHFVTSFSGKGDPKTGPSGFVTPMGMAIWDHVLYVTDYVQNRITMYDLTTDPIGAYLGVMDVGGAMANPMGIAVNSVGDFFITDASNARVKVIRHDGSKVAFGSSVLSGGMFLTPCGVAIDAEDNVWITDITLHQLYKFGGFPDATPTYPLLGLIGGFGNTAGKFSGPYGVAAGQLGDWVYVADTFNSRVEVFKSGLPRIISFSPTTAGIGEAVQINGTFFGSNAGTVTFTTASGTTPASCTNWLDTSISCTVPIGAIKGYVTVTNLEGSGHKSFTVAKPKITSLSALSGEIGTTLTITGLYFDGASATQIVNLTGIIADPPLVPGPTPGPTACVVSDWANHSITCTVPVLNWGSYHVTVTNDVGTSGNSTYKVVRPTITALVPTSGHAGSALIINGTGFMTASSTKKVKFVLVAAPFTETDVTSFTSWADTSIHVDVPTAASPTLPLGPYHVSVVNDAGESLTKTYTVK